MLADVQPEYVARVDVQFFDIDEWTVLAVEYGRWDLCLSLQTVVSFPVAAYTRFAVAQCVESALQAFVVASLGAA